MKLSNIYAIIKKDVLDALRNSRLLITIMVPVILGIGFNLLFADQSSEWKLTYYSPDESVLAEALDVVTEFTVAESEDAARAALDDGSAEVVVILPAGYDAAVQAGESPLVQIIKEEEGGSAINILQNVILQTTQRLAGQQPPVTFEIAYLQEPGTGGGLSLSGLDIRSFFMIQWVIMAVAMNGMFVVPSLLIEEKEQSTLDAILVSPVRFVEVAIGKMVVGLIYGLVSVTVIVIATNNGAIVNLPLLIAAVVITSVVLTLIGLIMGGVFNTSSALNSFGGILLLPFLLPVILIGVNNDLLQQIVQFIPTFFTAKALALSLGGQGTMDSLLLPGLIVVVQGVIALGAVSLLLRRERV